MGASQFTGNARFDGAVDVFGTFSSNGNANFSGTTTQFITQPTFLTALSIPLVGTGNATGVPTVSSLTLGNQAGPQGVIKLEDGTAGAPYGANDIQNIGYTLRFTGSDPTVNSVAFDMPAKFNNHMTVNGIGGTTVATKVKFKSYGKISNWVLTGGGTPTLPIVSSTTVAITGFTASDVPYLYCYASSYNSGTYNCPVIANVGSLGTSISFYANNLNASTTCQVYWSLKYIV